MVVTRSVQLTVKKSTMQQKTLEGSLMTISRDGERTSLSSRAAELDQLMPYHLGVSKAILDSVIFCHQDESLWPMSEPAPLKKKFDEIFEALKYTKAIDNIKSLRKAKNEELKGLKQRESDSKEMKSKGDRDERLSKELDVALKELKIDISDLDTKAKEASEKSQDAADHAAEYETIIGSLENHRAKQKGLQEKIEELGSDLKERGESDEWLQSELTNYAQRVTEHEQHEHQQKKQYQDLEQAVKNNEAKLSKKHIEAGKFEEQKSNYEQQIERRKALIKETSRSHNIRGYESDLDEMQINEYLERISKLSKEQNAAVEKARRETERELKKMQGVLTNLAERRTLLESNKASAKEQSVSNDALLRTKQSEVNNVETDESEQAILEGNIENLEVRLEKETKDFSKEAWDCKIRENEVQLRVWHEEDEQLSREMYEATKQVGELAHLDRLRKEMTNYQRNLEQMKVVHSHRLQGILGHIWEPSRLEVDFQGVIDQKTRDLIEAERQREVVSRSLEQFEYKLSNVKTELKKGDKELAACVKHLHDNVEGEPEDYVETLSAIQQERDLYKADFDNFENTSKYFAKGIAVAQSKKHCNLCQRSFHGKELTDFVKRIEEKLTTLTAEKVASDLKDSEEDLRKAKEAGPSHDTWLRLSKTELPRLKEDIKKLGGERDKMLQEIENHDKIVKDKEEAKLNSESLTKAVTNITKDHRDLTNRAHQIQETSKMQQGSSITRTVEDIRDQQQIVKRRAQDSRCSTDKLRTDQERARLSMSNLQVDLSKAKENLYAANRQLDKKQNILDQMEKLKAANQGHKAAIRDVEAKLEDLVPQIAEADSRIQDIRQRGSDKEENLQQEASRLKDSLRTLDDTTRNISAYIGDSGSARLARCQNEVDTLGREISSAKDQQRHVTVIVNKIRQALSSQEETKRVIKDNISYRKSLRDLELVKEEIAGLSARNAEADKDHWIKQRSHWQRKYDKCHTDRLSKVGAAKAKDDELVRLIKNWETDYKDAAYNFKKAHIDVEVIEPPVIS